MRILVTGGSGAIGAQVVRGLLATSKDTELIVVSRRARNIAGCRTIVCDLTDRSATQGLRALAKSVGCIVHLAADVRWNQPLEQALSVNTEVTASLLDVAAASSGLKRFVYVSTAFVDLNVTAAPTPLI